MSDSRYSRQSSFFGEEGQARIERTKFAIVGLGGTGSHVAQQLAYLGGLDFRLIDHDVIDRSSLNRMVTAVPDDARVSALKVGAAKRLILTIQGDASVAVVPHNFISEEGFAAIREADVVFGCVDRDSSRLVLNELCQAYEIPYIDIATDITATKHFGGRVHMSIRGERCVFCDDLLDQDAIRRETGTEEEERTDERIYGVPRSALGESGPSVISLNGLLVSAAITEFLAEWTGLRPGRRWLEYRGELGTLNSKTDAPKEHCVFCKGTAIRGQGSRADVERFLRGP